jgi:hypothetical protein
VITPVCDSVGFMVRLIASDSQLGTGPTR